MQASPTDSSLVTPLCRPKSLNFCIADLETMPVPCGSPFDISGHLAVKSLAEVIDPMEMPKVGVYY